MANQTRGFKVGDRVRVLYQGEEVTTIIAFGVKDEDPEEFPEPRYVADLANGEWCDVDELRPAR